MNEARIIYQSEFLRATLHENAQATGVLFCEFDYLNNARAGFPDIRREPWMCAHGFSVLRIDTSLNNWFLSEDVPALGVVLGELARNYDECVSLCFSMGIMGALMFSKHLRLKKLIAFSPVISIFEDDIRDRRFKSFRKHVTHPEYRELWKEGALDIHGSVCFDPFVPIDVLQARLVHEYYKKLLPVAMPFGAHPCTKIVKEVSGFKSIQNLIVNDQFDPYVVRQLHKETREKSVAYKAGMKKRRASVIV